MYNKKGPFQGPFYCLLFIATCRLWSMRLIIFGQIQPRIEHAIGVKRYAVDTLIH